MVKRNQINHKFTLVLTNQENLSLSLIIFFFIFLAKQNEADGTEDKKLGHF